MNKISSSDIRGSEDSIKLELLTFEVKESKYYLVLKYSFYVVLFTNIKHKKPTYNMSAINDLYLGRDMRTAPHARKFCFRIKCEHTLTFYTEAKF